MRLVPLVAVALFALLAGCGSSSSTQTQESPATKASTTPSGVAVRSCSVGVAGMGQLRVTGVGCDVGRRVVATWAGKSACQGPAGTSRPACSAGGYRCLGARTARGIAVSCARPGRSISFVAERR